MSVTVLNLVMGPAQLYAAAFGSTEPLDSAITPNGVTTPPGAPWVDVGGTNGGINLEIDSTYTDLEVDQITTAVGARLTDEAITVAAKLAEITLSNINQALNQICLLAGGSGYSTLDIPVGSVTTQPVYAALIVDGWAPYTVAGNPARRRAIVRKVLSQTKVGLMSDKKTQQGIDCTWKAYYISSGVNLVHIVDQTA